MIEVTMPAMTCNHCVTTITNAVKEVDKDAKLQFSLRNHKVVVETDLDKLHLKETIERTGYEVASLQKIVTALEDNCCNSCHV